MEIVVEVQVVDTHQILELSCLEISFVLPICVKHNEFFSFPVDEDRKNEQEEYPHARHGHDTQM